MNDTCKHCSKTITLMTTRPWQGNSVSTWRHMNGLMLCVPDEDDPAFTGVEVAEPLHGHGLYGMTCFNGLSEHQQQRVVEWGNLAIGYVPMGKCLNGAEVEVTTMWDKFPGPRFYCAACAVLYLSAMREREPS